MPNSNATIRKQCRYAIFAFAILSSGCASTIQSTRFDEQSTTIARGLTYSLPKAQVRISVVRAKETEDDLEKAIEALKKLKEKIEKAEKDTAKFKETLAKDEALAKLLEGPAKGAQAIKIDRSKARVLLAKKDLDTALAEIPKLTEVAQKSKDAQGKFVEKITITDLGVFADRNQTFLANLNHLPTRDDSMQLGVVDGLLTSTGKATADDKSADILLSLANIVGSRSNSNPNSALTKNIKSFLFAQSNTTDVEPDGSKCTAINQSFVFDPSDLSDVRSTLRKFANLKFSFSLQVQAIDSEDPKLNEKIESGASSNQAVVDGLIYRPTTAVRILVKPKNRGEATKDSCFITDKIESEVVVLNVPDTGRLAYLPMDSGALNSNSTSYTFEKGSPKEFSTSRASEIAALLKIPVNIAKALISVPTDFIKLRVDYSSDEIKLLKNQLDKLQAAQDLKDKLKLLESEESD
jgi:hypothetical protein